MAGDKDWLALELEKNHKDHRLVYIGSALGLCLLIGISVLIFHHTKHDTPVNLTNSSASVPSSDTLSVGGSTTSPTTSTPSTQGSTPSTSTLPITSQSSTSASTYTPPVYTTLQSSDTANYNNLFSLFDQLDGAMTASDYTTAYQIAVTNSNSIGTAGSKVNPQSMSNYIYYTSSIQALIGKISAQLPTIDSDYDTSIIGFQNYNSSSDQSSSSAQLVLQNAQSQLAAARSALNQIQGYYSQIPQ
jgi:hypothetical protein